MKKIVKTAALGLLTIIILAFVLYYFLNLRINNRYMENVLEDNFEELTAVNTYLLELKGNSNDSALIRKEDIEVYLEKNKIGNDIIKDKFDFIFNNGFQLAEIKNNYIMYQRWSNLDVGRGLVYSIDGKAPNEDYITKLEKTRKKNWYYYEEDYNKWRLWLID